MILFVLPAAATTTVQLADGLRVALDANPTARTVTVATVVEVGEIDDPAGEEGTAHVVEHLWFDTTGADGVRTWDALVGAGCQVGAWTHSDHTSYVTQCPVSGTETLVARELARWDGPLAGVGQGDVDRALAVVGHESIDRTEAPFLVVLPSVYEALYPEDHPIVARNARPSEGPLAIDALRARVERTYAPGNATIAVIGAFDEAAVLATLVERHGAPTGTVVAVPPRVGPPQRRTLRVAPRVADLPVRDPGVVLAWAPPADVTMGIRGTVMAQLVGEQVQRRWAFDPRVVNAGCGSPEDGLGQPVICWIDAADDVPLDGLAAELRELADKLWTGQHRRLVRQVFGPVRSQSMVAEASREDDHTATSDGWAMRLAWSVHRSGAVDPTERALAELEALAVGPLVEAAREYLAPMEALVVIVRPSERAPSVFAAAPAPAPPAASTVVPSSSPPLRVEEVTIPGGVHAVAIQRPDAQLVHVGARRVQAPGSIDHALALELAALPRVMPSSLRDVFVTDGSELGVDGVVTVDGSDLRAVLDALATQVATPRLSLPRLSAGVLHETAEQTRSASDAAHWAMWGAIVATHPDGDAAYVALGRQWATEIDLDALYQAMVAQYAPERLGVVVVGPQDPATLLEAAVAVFPASGAAVTVESEPEPPVLEARPVMVVEDPGSQRARIRAVCRTPEGGRAAREVAVAALWDLLFRRLRDERSLVYTPSVSTQGTAVLLAMDVPASAAVEALAVTAGAIDDLLAARVPRDVEVARNRLVLGAPSVGDPRAALAFALGTEQVRGAAEITGWAAALGEVGPQDVAAALAGCDTGLAVGIGGPTELVTALQEAGRTAEATTTDGVRAWIASTLAR